MRESVSAVETGEAGPASLRHLIKRSCEFPAEGCIDSDREVGVDITGTETAREVSLDDLFAGAARNARGETTLAAGEMASAVLLPATAAGGDQCLTDAARRVGLRPSVARRTPSCRWRGACGPCRVSASVKEDVPSGASNQRAPLRWLANCRPCSPSVPCPERGIGRTRGASRAHAWYYRRIALRRALRLPPSRFPNASLYASSRARDGKPSPSPRDA